MFTFLPLPEIAKIMEQQKDDPSKRVAQHALAFEFVELIHGKQEAEAVSVQHRQLFRPRESTAEPTPLAQAGRQPPAGHFRSPTASFVNPQAGNQYAPQTNFSNMPSVNVTLPRSLVYDQPFNRVLWHAGLVSSKSEGHRIIKGAGAYVGSRPGESGPMSDELSFTPIKPWTANKTAEFVHDESLLILKLGKWKFKLVNIISDAEFRERGLTAPGWESQQDEN